MANAQTDFSYTYIIRCDNNSLYTGITKDVPRRMAEHYYHKKQGAKYTKSCQATEVMMVWKSVSWSAAATLEHFIKTLSKSQKIALINLPEAINAYSESKLKGHIYEPVSDYNGPIADML